MKKTIYIFSIFWIVSNIALGQTNFLKVSDPFILDTKDPYISLVNPTIDTFFFINDSIEVKWDASDESLGDNPISIGIRTQEFGQFTLLKENIPNTGSAYVYTDTTKSTFAKINIIAQDTFGITSQDTSAAYFDLILGYSKLAFNIDTATFGPNQINTTSDTSMFVWIKNDGNKELVINSAGGLSSPFDFVISTPATILAGDSLSVEITLERNFPIGIYQDSLIIDTTSKAINYLPISATLYSSWPNVDCGPDITKCSVSTVSIFTNVSGGVPPYTYSWNNDSTYSSFSTSHETDSMFVVIVTDALGLKDTTTIWVFIQQVDQNQEICIVTVDSLSQKNIIVWEKNDGFGTDYYLIYKLGQLPPLDTVYYDSLSVYIDLSSDPEAYPDEYWITSVDTCGNESGPSPHHKTILLQPALGVQGNVLLGWNDYVGFNYNHFHIYRGTSYNNMNLIQSIPFGTNSFNDNDPPALETVYRIIVEKADSSICNPTIGKAASGPFKQSLSNIGDGGDDFKFLLTAFLEGPFQSDNIMNTDLYQSGSIPMIQPFNTSPWFYDGEDFVSQIPNENIVDWILVEIRKTAGNNFTATSDKTILKRAAFLLNSGLIVDLDGYSNLIFNAIIPTEGDHLYGVLWHRNHLGIMSNSPLEWNPNLGRYEYNFTISPNSAYIYNDFPQKLVSEKWVMISGDANSDGSIDISDIDSLWINQAGESGYKTGDINLDGVIDNQDKNDFWFYNIGKESQVPE